MLKIFKNGKNGNFYNIGSNKNFKNIDICNSLIKIAKSKVKIGSNVKINFVKDRPGHDIRYALSSNKIKKELKWKAKTNLKKGLEKTFMWYLHNNKYYKSLTKKDIIVRLGVEK